MVRDPFLDSDSDEDDGITFATATSPRSLSNARSIEGKVDSNVSAASTTTTTATKTDKQQKEKKKKKSREEEEEENTAKHYLLSPAHE